MGSLSFQAAERTLRSVLTVDPGGLETHRGPSAETFPSGRGGSSQERFPTPFSLWRPGVEHPSEDALLRFLFGATSPLDNRWIVRHLLARCPFCAQALRRLSPSLPMEPGACGRACARHGS